MHIRRPSAEELRTIAKSNHFGLTDEEVGVFGKLIDNALTSYERLDELFESKKQLAPKREASHYPTRSENPYGAWAWKCSVKTSTTGLLSGKRIAIKDNVCVAGIPLVNGSAIMENFIPQEDAAIVKRILGAGGEIAGKARCENLCVSGGSHTSYPEPVRNPRNPSYMAGGSSSGSAALLAAGEVNMAIGGDQAGSIRIPSSWCGVYGLKPTWGLVPYTGAIPMELSLDHLGPMANSVHDVALLLEVIAGKDGIDPRQMNTPSELPPYTKGLEVGARGLRIGVVTEGFGWESLSEKDVDEKVREAANLFTSLGAQVSEVSIPEHRDGVNVWSGIVTEGTWSTAVRDNGLEHSGIGHFDTHFIESWAVARSQMSDKLSSSMKFISLLGNYMAERYHGRYFALAQNLRKSLTQAYDRALQNFDLLLMPTTPQKAQPLKDMNLREYVDATMINLHNTCPFDVTGHPAMNVPCGTSEGLPVGMMLIGRHFDEKTVLRAAFAFEQRS